MYALREILEKDGIKLPVVSKAGIPTSCYVNYTLYDNCASVGETKVSNCGHDGKCYDEDVIPLLEENLKSYVSGTDSSSCIWAAEVTARPTPTGTRRSSCNSSRLCDDADVANRCTLEQLYNSYDNTILYVDHVLGEIIQALDPPAFRTCSSICPITVNR